MATMYASFPAVSQDSARALMPSCPVVRRASAVFLTDRFFVPTQLAALRALQQKVRSARETSPLFDTQLLAQNMERVFFAMFSNWVKHGEPRNLSVDSVRRDRAPETQGDAKGTEDACMR